MYWVNEIIQNYNNRVDTLINWNHLDYEAKLIIANLVYEYYLGFPSEHLRLLPDFRRKIIGLSSDSIVYSFEPFDIRVLFGSEINVFLGDIPFCDVCFDCVYDFFCDVYGDFIPFYF